MYMYNMAKTLMISNKVYEELKKIKDSRSFTDTIMNLIDRKELKKTGASLKECLGLLNKGDKEYNKIFRDLAPLYKKWTKRYA